MPTRQDRARDELARFRAQALAAGSKIFSWHKHQPPIEAQALPFVLERHYNYRARVAGGPSVHADHGHTPRPE